MSTKSLAKMLLGRLIANKASRRTSQRLSQFALLSQIENLESRLLLTADPDDQIRDAIQLGTIATPVTRNDSINLAIDVDVYRVDVAAGQRLSFDIDRPAGSQLDSYLRLFNSSGQQLAFNDDAAAPGEVRGLDSFLEFTFATAGSYYLGVSGFGNRSYDAVTGLGDTNGRTGNYALVVSATTTTVTSSDADDQISEAVNLAEIGQPVTRTGTIDVATDVDMYRFTLSAAQRVQIDIDRPSGSLDSFLRVFNSTGVEVARNDDGPNPGEAASNESFLDLNLSAGTYFVSVSGFGNSSFNAVTGAGDTAGSIGNYSLTVTPPDPDSDDQISQAVDLGAISSSVTRSGLSIDVAIDVDMFRFTATAGQTIRFDVDVSSLGFDSFIRLFNASGNELARNDDGPTPGEPSSLESYLEFTFTGAGTYFLGVSGFGNSTYSAVAGTGDLAGSTGQYSLVVSTGIVQPPPPPTNNRVLYLNFDGANISRTDLVRWAGSDWASSVNEFDADQNGIVVQPLLRNRADREQIITQLISMVQIDLNPFGISVVRHTGGAVEGQGVSTLFLGPSTLSNDYYHVAGDIDFGNNNRTDIAFVGDEDWGSASNTAIALADVALHEAGHTFGLYHVQSGTAPESMGLRYNTPQSSWVTDTRFVDQAFNELPGHGGGRGPQNAYQYMLQTFGSNGSAPTATGGGNSLSPKATQAIVRDAYRERPHNLPVQAAFAPDADHHDHDHGDGVTEVIAIATRQEATRSSAETGSHREVRVATSHRSEHFAPVDSSPASESPTRSNALNDGDHATSSSHAELVQQLNSASWGRVLESLHSLT
ncbi:MAG: DVUA0089 family protein [Planctomycetaceae bacterium]